MSKYKYTSEGGIQMSCCGSSNKNQNKNTNNVNLTPIEQLKVRLAQGEISIEEYLKTKSILDQ
jgi:uncharacterized membrane protein